jgi:thymidylate synthase (FAD)
LRIIEPSVEVEMPIDGEAVLKGIERIGRVCYKSEARIGGDIESAAAFVGRIVKSGHESVIEHASASMRVICDRGVTHEIVRHRIASYSQESTRYCNYLSDKFNGEVTFIRPCFFEEGGERYAIWAESMRSAETAYRRLIDSGASPQQARGVLPNSLKTEIVMTMNLREWRHFIKLRTAPGAHPQMRQVASMLLGKLKGSVPLIFDDL